MKVRRPLWLVFFRLLPKRLVLRFWCVFSCLSFPADLWTPILAALSVATMTLGNLVALTQHNIKRMLAYSSIAHAGYALIGVVSVSALGLVSVVYYLLAYLVTNLAAFGVVAAYGKRDRFR